jgi:hypothetical protein
MKYTILLSLELAMSPMYFLVLFMSCNIISKDLNPQPLGTQCCLSRKIHV